MVKRKPTQEPKRQAILTRRFGVLLFLAAVVPLFPVSTAQAIPVSEYHQHVKQGVTALETLTQSDENESVATYAARDVQTIQRVRDLIPPVQAVELNGANLHVDNSWLHQELDKFAKDTSEARYAFLRTITERLKAIEDRLEELEKPTAGTAINKAEASRKLEEILRRPEYAHQAPQKNALTRLLERFFKWLMSWLPEPKPVAPDRVSILSRIAQWFVIVLTLGVLAFVLKLLWSRMSGSSRPKKKRKATARIVLGETLEADQSAVDLLAEAEALARRGELRAAIRRAYIALLVELGDRKIISLAQYKTNRDYLRAMREIEPLYRNVKQLTDSFERHWYGLAQANETDWQTFRAAYNQALK
ncbi:MAG: DUF4129 domain-containing protein [Acidobacteriota bacterium]